MTLFQGAGVALVTPFEDGKVDYKRLEALIKWQLSCDIDAIITCGTTGEASTLSDEEHKEIVRFTVEKVGGQIPVIAGAGSNDTAHALMMSKELQDVGADGLLTVTPYYNKCTQKGLIEHYTAIADQIKIPMIIYSVPSRTGVNISPFAVSVLSHHPNICGIKEASGDISQVVKIAGYCTNNFSLYSGNDDSTIPILSLGGKGVISTVANIVPKEMHAMAEGYLNGDQAEALRLQLQLKDLMDAMFTEVNPIPVKAALGLMGKIKPEYRLPLCAPSPTTMETIKGELKAYGLI